MFDIYKCYVLVSNNSVNARVIDRLYKDGNEEALNEFDDSANIESNNRNTFSHYFDFEEEGDYNIYKQQSPVQFR
jgi:hypothetical protein